MSKVLASTPTGKVIKEYLDSYEITQKELSQRTGISEKHLSHLLNGTSRLTEETALKLEKVLTGVPASYWLNYETKYREAVAREQSPAYSADSKELQLIAKRFKFNEVFKDFGWSLQKQADQMLSLLQISDFSQFERVYATMGVSFMQDGGTLEAIAIWLNLCREEVEVQNEHLENQYNEVLLKTLLPKLKVIADTSDAPASLTEARELLNQAGIYLVIHEPISQAKIRGALSTYKKHPAIYLSLRFKTHDHAWFALMHEIGHLVLQYSKKEPIITLDIENGIQDEKEQAANHFAQTFFINESAYSEFIKQEVFTTSSVVEFAKTIAIHPGLVVARLQHDALLPFSHLNGLKSRFDGKEGEDC